MDEMIKNEKVKFARNLERGYQCVQDGKKAIEIYLEEASKQDSSAMLYLSKNFIKGNFVQKNIELGLKYLQKSIDLDNPQAMCIMGVYLRQGLIVEKNLEKTIELFDKAIDLGYPDAYFHKGFLYEKGIFYPIGFFLNNFKIY